MALTNLTGTKWTINSVTCTAGYGMFNVNYIHNDSAVEGISMEIGYAPNHGQGDDVPTANSVFLMPSMFMLSADDVIEITGGDAVTNTNLISWLESHATQVVPEISAIQTPNGTKYNIKDATARESLATKQDTLVSGTNIKTINSQSILGSGNLEINADACYTIECTDTPTHIKTLVATLTSTDVANIVSSNKSMLRLVFPVGAVGYIPIVMAAGQTLILPSRIQSYGDFYYSCELEPEDGEYNLYLREGDLIDVSFTGDYNYGINTLTTHDAELDIANTRPDYIYYKGVVQFKKISEQIATSDHNRVAYFNATEDNLDIFTFDNSESSSFYWNHYEDSVEIQTLLNTYATKTYVTDAIAALPEPMIFKGTLGTGGTITSLPTASSANEGFTYKVITAGTYASQTAKVGDVFISNGSAWVVIPSGDDVEDTWRAINVNGSSFKGNGISTGAVNFKSGSNVTISASGNDITINASDTDTGATSVEVTGSGNAVTGASYDASTRKISLSKGTTFATSTELATKQNTLTTSSVNDGTLDKAIGFDASGNLVKGAAGSSIPTITIDSSQVISSYPLLQFTLTSAQQALWGSQSPVINFEFLSPYASYSGVGTYQNGIYSYIRNTGTETISLSKINSVVTASIITIPSGHIPEHSANEVLFYSKAPFSITVSNPQWDGNLYLDYDEENAWDGTSYFAQNTAWGYYYISLYGVGNTVINSTLHVSSPTGNLMYCIGNINVLLDKSYANRTDLVLPANCFRQLFAGCNNVDFDVTLPAISVGNYCYQQMFAGCYNMTKAPELPATTLGEYCYSAMFVEDTYLTKIPEVLPATTLSDYCYEGMFDSCSSIQYTPRLPATTLADGCYHSMFSSCYSLLTLPELPATALTQACYRAMFNGCENIKLSTTQTGEYQIPYRIPSVDTGTDATNALRDMFAATGGTFDEGTPTINTTYYTSNRIIEAEQIGGGTAEAISYTTTAPSADNPTGIKFVILEQEPATRYSGYYYIITGGSGEIADEALTASEINSMWSGS